MPKEIPRSIKISFIRERRLKKAKLKRQMQWSLRKRREERRRSVHRMR
jgi:hypothetical protein